MRCSERGVEFGHVTLHVGAGTFQPMRAESLAEHVMHSEWLNVGAGAVRAGRAGTRARGGRVIAVGTTVVRALETAMRDGELQPFAGETQIFIFPGYRIRRVDALLTNFHLPESTLADAGVGVRRTRAHSAAYRACGARSATGSFPTATPCCCIRSPTRGHGMSRMQFRTARPGRRRAPRPPDVSRAARSRRRPSCRWAPTARSRR